MKTNEYKAFLKAHAKKDYAWLADKTGRREDAVRKMYTKLGLPAKRVNSQNTKTVDPEDQLQLDMEKLRLSFTEKNTSKKYQLAIGEINRLRQELDTLATMKGKVSTYVIRNKASTKHAAVAVAVASDWHIEERVRAESVGGSNEYSMEIAKKRAETFFRNTLKLVKKEQQDSSIDTLLLALLGDFISSNIHDELMESCEVSPVDAALFAQNLLASGIEYLLANSALKLIIPCAVGNHSRITDKVHVSTEQGNSLEWMIYHNLADHFKDNQRVQFILSRDYFNYVDVYGYLLRFHHGHAMKYGGGIGGLTIPVLKAISRYDLKRKAYLDVFGHFHNPMDGGKFISNGCLIGDTPYGNRLGFTGKPQQQFFLIDRDNGKTGVFSIFIG